MAVIVDGVVRVYWNCNQLADGADDDPVQMVSAFHAMPSLIAIKRGPGLILDWSQAAGTFAVGGDYKGASS